MTQENNLFQDIKNVLEDVEDDYLIQIVIDNVSLEPFTGVLKTKRNKRKIFEFLQKHFGLVKYAYAKGQKNYWIIRGFTKEQAEQNSKQYSKCYSRSPEKIAQKYNCSLEQAEQIFRDRNNRAQQSRDNLPDEEKQRINKLKKQSKQAFIERYGEEEGTKRYEERVAKFKRSTSLTGLVERYGEEEGTRLFNERNLSRSSSLNSLIEKYGEEEGRLRYQQQVERKAHAQTLQGYIDRYGFELGCERYQQRQQKFVESWNNKSPDELARIRNLQKQSLETMQQRYGEEEGLKRYHQWLQTRRFRASAESLKVFVPMYTWLLDQGFEDDDIYFGYQGKKEFFIIEGKEFFSYDFCIKSLHLIVEFNGILYHPKTRDQKDWHIPYCDLTAEQKYDMDQHKMSVAQQHGFKVIVLWEDVDCVTNLKYAVDVIKVLNGAESETN